MDTGGSWFLTREKPKYYQTLRQWWGKKYGFKCCSFNDVQDKVFGFKLDHEDIRKVGESGL